MVSSYLNLENESLSYMNGRVGEEGLVIPMLPVGLSGNMVGMKYRLFRHAIATPFIWSMFFPTVLADIFLEIYHRICFPLYGIPYVRRSEYIRIVDRAKLPYLTWWEKIGCAYCGYVNGWLHYASVIAGKTEHYWCAIAHLEERGYRPAEHEKDFVAYGDEMELRKRYAIRDETAF